MKRTRNRSGVIHAPENDTETIKLIISGSRIRGMKPGLKKFKEYISRNNYFWDEHTRKFVEYIVTLSQKNTLLFEHDYLIDDVYHISRHHQDRVRDISTWINTIKDDPEKQIKALAKHMFDEHGDVPEFMYKYWHHPEYYEKSDQYQQLFIYLGSGKGITKYEGLPMKVTKGMAKHFLTAHESCTVNSAITYAHVMSLGGNWTIYFDLFCSDLCDYIEGDRFWMSVAEYIIKNKSLFNVATIWNLYEYINYIKFSNNAAEPDFEIKGRSPEKLISKAVEYDTKSRYIVTNVCWTPLRIKGYIKSDDINSEHYYIIEQISDFASLMNEASEQHNCLETYLDDCITGETSVWSLYLTLNCSKKKIKLVTIEVKPDKTISQALGKCNRYITGFEMQIIQEWALREGLYISDKIKIK